MSMAGQEMVLSESKLMTECYILSVILCIYNTVKLHVHNLELYRLSARNNGDRNSY